jgi:hypothetical protein
MNTGGSGGGIDADALKKLLDNLKKEMLKDLNMDQFE